MSDRSTYVMRAKCLCGTCVIDMKQAPKVRLNCHCTLCQSFTGSPYSDVMVLPAHRAVIRNEENIFFKYYRKHRLPPPNLKRGRCKTCDFPFVEVWGINPVKVLLFIRVPGIEGAPQLPLPEHHMFYEHHVADIDDGVPKHYGYFDSEWAMARMILHSY